MDNIISYILCFGWLPWLLFGLLGFGLGAWLFSRNRSVGDLSMEGEGQLRAEADGLRARINELEGNLTTSNSEVSSLKTKLATAGAGVAAGAVAASAAGGAAANDDDETYALEWRNRYLAARVKYLEGRIAEAPKKKAPAKKKAVAKKKTVKVATAKPVVKKAAPKKKVTVKKAAPKKKVTVKKAAAKKVTKTRVLYDKPTEGKPDDLKLISGVGPKLEKTLNKTGVYYFKQIANWNKSNVKMVNDKLDAFPGRIERDEWVRQAKGLAKGTGAAKAKPAAKKAPAKKAPAKTAKSANDKYYAWIRKYDSRASMSTIDNIVKYCGPSLKSRDASLVACSDEAELNRIAKGFCTKKLGMKSGQAELVKKTCEKMKGDRMKNRAVFYYLAAKSAGKLGIFK
jgi:predicted flap endonuclease-1-like 5' DNA nuclease